MTTSEIPADSNTVVPAAAPVSPAEWRVERRDYYVGVTHKLLIGVLGLAAALVIMVIVIGYLVTRGPVIQNYGLTPDLRVIEMAAVDQPMVTEQQMRNWAADALRAIYSYDFVHWRDQLNSNRALFSTDEAFAGFVAAMQQSGALNTVRRKKLVVSSILREPPNITNKGLYQGRYSWRVQVPINVRYESASSSMTQELLVNLLVQRVPQTVNPRGLGISQIIAPRQ